jgi:DNA-binding transcriptional LysR family regulator
MHLPLRAIAIFHTAAKAGSITRAAQELGVTPSAVSQQIASLEIHVGTSLMARVGRGIVLTEAGERYFQMIAASMEHISDATDSVRGYVAVKPLVVRVTPSLATKWLLPRLGGFLEAHPNIELRIDATNEPTDFLREGVDLEIRHGEGNWPGLHAEGLVEERFLPVCAPGVCQPGSLDVSGLPRFRLIHSVKSQVQWVAWFAAAGVVPTERWKRVLFDRSHMAVDAAVNGLGIALESDLMMQRELHDGALACPLRAPLPVFRVTQWLVFPHERLRRQRVRVFVDWVRAQRDQWAATRDALPPRP